MFGLAPEWFGLLAILGMIGGTVGGTAAMSSVSPMLAVPAAAFSFAVLALGGRSPIGIVHPDAREAKAALLASLVGALALAALTFRTSLFHAFAQ